MPDGIAFFLVCGFNGTMTDLSHLAQPGTQIAVRVTPRASRNAVILDGETIRVTVTTVPEDGRANAAVVKLLAKALGVAKSRLVLVRGATGRDKIFRLD
ncbi:hypothetical protein SAMN02746000_00435 [Paracoccus sp. J56]|nr:hypothetical protein SAMN02746000_00435 [Paracoccus sp. J56]